MSTIAQANSAPFIVGPRRPSAFGDVCELDSGAALDSDVIPAGEQEPGQESSSYVKCLLLLPLLLLSLCNKIQFQFAGLYLPACVSPFFFIQMIN